MSEAIITVENLGKRYSLRHQQGERYTALRDVIAHRAKSLFRRRNGASDFSISTSQDISVSRAPTREDFWALKDVSFEVNRGEVLGIIGRNGAGKSTLLKILSRITEPTEGRIRIRGRVASLLEVGTGFHPELTGRENIYLNGAILGMQRVEIKAKFDEIVGFAEVTKFLDTPVKRYSSGMYVRLAFAVAAHLEPEILVVDEVLSVGDAEFQKKCLGKMQDVSRSGRTVLFVSHNMAAVQSLCSGAIFLKNGTVAGRGDVASQVGMYLHDADPFQDSPGAFPKRLSAEITLDDFSLEPRQVISGDSFSVNILLRSEKRNKINDMAILVYSAQGVRISVLDLRSQSIDLSLVPGEPLHLIGRVEHLPVVEERYVFGMYLVCGDCSGDFLDLAALNVAAKDRQGPVYPANVRGVLELDYKFTKSTPLAASPVAAEDNHTAT